MNRQPHNFPPITDPDLDLVDFGLDLVLADFDLDMELADFDLDMELSDFGLDMELSDFGPEPDDVISLPLEWPHE